MAAQKDSFANRIRTAVKELAVDHAEVTTTMVANQAKLMTFKETKRMYTTLSHLTRAGELQRVRQGVYRSVNKKKPTELREIMWRLLRMQRRSVEDLVEMAGASEPYAKEWLLMLVRRKVVRDDNGIYQIINDTVEMPSNDDKAAKLRLLRANKKAMHALNHASAAIILARDAITNLDKELKGD